LEAFAAGMLGSLTRRDQRAKDELHVRGLMLDGKRKSMQPMAERLGVDHQRLQQRKVDQQPRRGPLNPLITKSSPALSSKTMRSSR
jgi:SRSO17 transposase